MANQPLVERKRSADDLEPQPRQPRQPPPECFSTDSSFWNAAKTADLLEQRLNERSNNYLKPFESTARSVCSILRMWQDQRTKTDEMGSFLRAPQKLLHETEESIVALHHLREWWFEKTSEEEDGSSFVAVDVCCGKGFFSMYLSYLVAIWSNTKKGCWPRLERIILLDKSTESDINWKHIAIVNRTAEKEGRPILELWSGTNLHDTDALLSRLSSFPAVALTGVHLCRELTISFCNISNALGEKCCYACVAPCCLPRRVTKRNGNNAILRVHKHETANDRQRRLDYVKLRLSRSCFLCQCPHMVRQCPLFPQDKKKQSEILQQSVLKTPCWNCGVVGHFAADCPTPQANKPSATPPTKDIDASFIASSVHPFDSYCQLIASHGFEGKKATLFDVGLQSEQSTQKHWNSGRKSTFIVTTAETKDSF